MMTAYAHSKKIVKHGVSSDTQRSQTFVKALYSIVLRIKKEMLDEFDKVQTLSRETSNLLTISETVDGNNCDVGVTLCFSCKSEMINAYFRCNVCSSKRESPPFILCKVCWSQKEKCGIGDHPFHKPTSKPHKAFEVRFRFYKDFNGRTWFSSIDQAMVLMDEDLSCHALSASATPDPFSAPPPATDHVAPVQQICMHTPKQSANHMSGYIVRVDHVSSRWPKRLIPFILFSITHTTHGTYQHGQRRNAGVTHPFFLISHLMCNLLKSPHGRVRWNKILSPILLM